MDGKVGMIMDDKTLHLGLIGDNIAASRAPVLHRLAGEQNGLSVRYDRLVPSDMAMSFEQVFEQCRAIGYRGLNITYPYKERIVPFVRIDDPLVRAMGAVNTVLFDPSGPMGFNTDYSGFVAAYQGARGQRATGPVLMIGTGGVGRAVAFGLAALGTTDIRMVDRDRSKAEGLAQALNAADMGMEVTIWDDVATAAQGAVGLINCTPVGMVGYNGSPVSPEAMIGAEWVFDAVYTPVMTQFLSDATAQGLEVISGWELFFFQGVHAWSIFADAPLDQSELRVQLQNAAAPDRPAGQ